VAINGTDLQILGSLEAKIDRLSEDVAEVRKEQKEVAAKAITLVVQMSYVDALREKVQDLENWRAYQKGWVAAAGLAGGLIGWLLSLLTRK
jgi:hypothetical protein